ncbi:hypothetical protein BFP97_16430 [Roseivirga sp. 4D4]|uniref:universal stress protein n=1 Tax=Roseivirga sp. 4D4 TaxID=1889784 RepID=UPI000853BEDA|nr:universal stress protein [Roseivirga sp. 4D4]OEK03011.1 hypothetical protein BFP97_16430 [Roseivirga sp. 4D4]
MKKLLVPVDFSECSKNALSNAVQIAERMQMEVLLFHSVIVPIGLAEGVPVGNIGYDFEELEKSSRNRIEELIDKTPSLSKVPHRSIIQYGSLHESINELSKDEEIALIVMGTHGASGIAKALIGSNAYHVIKHVEIPVIALPEDANVSRMKHIALAGDYRNVPDHDAIHLVVDIVKAFLAQLHVIHIDKGDVLVKEQIDIARSMDKYLKHINHSFHFRKFDDVEEGLLEFAKEANVEMIAMISKHHSFLDRLRHASHTRKMILDIPMPIMVIHD